MRHYLRLIMPFYVSKLDHTEWAEQKSMSESTNDFQNQRSLCILMQIHLVLHILFHCHLSILFEFVFVSETVLFPFLLLFKLYEFLITFETIRIIIIIIAIRFFLFFVHLKQCIEV